LCLFDGGCYIALWENGVKNEWGAFGGANQGSGLEFVALVCPSSLPCAHRKFILGIFPAAEIFLPTFCVVTKSRSPKANLSSLGLLSIA